MSEISVCRKIRTQEKYRAVPDRLFQFLNELFVPACTYGKIKPSVLQIYLQQQETESILYHEITLDNNSSNEASILFFSTKGHTYNSCYFAFAGANFSADKAAQDYLKMRSRI
ncbi:hypothetical protein LOTGIDRAFT_173610 [Lottia gigantea]|uniref:Uncharacterized protein n=1 Tax=Lottia gigantea TaxID=225164 RepID=V4A6V7_LOTGI|nr:hypothetical protein LOTGIDRAFT_173610 [Lottia gigantea]ESO99668.1 hypothetical protein LOTGIDRAFT_173610 [Lottia gigantea]